ncbi:hypothetical protein [Methylobacterium sp. ap11]|uniref:hypothetical protein n=1 Tax=Methylobacterium sp. ap11 TaxID=1761799 RepID=UPI001160109B|nr:hypothetical protein [Methylobacterium sp. ap11]
MTTMIMAANQDNKILVDENNIKFSLVQFPWLKSVSPIIRIVNNDQVILNDALMMELEKAGIFEKSEETVIVSTMTGNENHIISLLKNEDPFDFILPDEEDLPLEENANIISYDIMYRMILNRVEQWWPFVRGLKKLTERRIMQVSPVPPIGDNDRILEKLDQYFKENSENPEISSKILRYKTWRLLSKILQDLCEKDDVEFVPVPQSMLEDGKFLSRDGWYTDATHGSPEYSKSVLKEISSRL